MTKTKAKAPVVSVPKTAVERKRRLSPREWVALEAIWEAGDMTLITIAEKCGLSPRAVQGHMAAHKIIRGIKKGELRKRADEAIAIAHADDAAILITRIRETKEEHFKMVDGLGKLTWAEIIKAKKELLPMASITMNLKALDIAITNIKKIREEKWALLGLDKEDASEDEGLPDLVVSELTADQVMALRNRDHTLELEELPEIEEVVDDVVDE